MEYPDTTLLERPIENAQIDSNQIKKNKLINFAQSVLHHPLYSKEFQHILSQLNLREEEVIKDFLEYNLEIYSPKGNDIYMSLPNRVTLHIHNLLKNSWHIERQQTIAEFVNKMQPKTLADIGFGVPTKYLKEIVINQNTKVTLFDFADSAFKFAEVILNLWHPQWNSMVSFQNHDMNEDNINEAFDLYIFQDSIEHALDPTSALIKYVESSAPFSKFILSLPIGPLIPRHFIAWHTQQEAIDWLSQCGLKIESSKSIFVNLEVDLFAEAIDPSYHNLVVLCSKKE